MKAPNFTRENAGEMARRATKSRVAREQREKEQARLRDLEARALVISREVNPDPDDARERRIKKQIDTVLSDMESAKSPMIRLKLVGALERLWNLLGASSGPKTGGNRPARPGHRPLALPASRTQQSGT